MLVVMYAIAHVKINLKQKTNLSQLSKVLLTNNFEWLSGIRKYPVQLFILCLLALATCWIKIIPLFSLWLLTSIVSSFYYECEPLQILFASEKNAKQFLIKKIKMHTLQLIIVFSPIIIINSVFNPDAILINLIFVLIQIMFLWFAILIKYSVYSPNDNLTQNTVLVNFALFGSVIPFLLPVPIIMNIRNYKKAVSNLNFYFNDYN